MYNKFEKLAEDCGLPSAEKYTLFIIRIPTRIKKA